MSSWITNTHEIRRILFRFPRFELPHELQRGPLKEVCPNTHLFLAIPYGKKFFLWYTSYDGQTGCFWMELNHHKIIRILFQPVAVAGAGEALFYDTVVYGTQINPQWFVCEDVLLYQGIPVYQNSMHLRLHTWKLWISSHRYVGKTWLSLPTMEEDVIPPYAVHHNQTRYLYQNKSYQNHHVSRVKDTKTMRGLDSHSTQIFSVCADLVHDIYHLTPQSPSLSTTSSRGPLQKDDIAYIPNLKTSYMMNKIFRNVRENTNIDFIEESDDEDDLNDVRPDKYVDLEKRVLMKCVFHPKFRRWVPIYEIAEETSDTKKQRIV